jgi:hypothetical protein
MNSRDLTEQQRDALIDRLVPTLGCLTKLGRRMDQRGFAEDDLRRKVAAAQSAMQDMTMAIRYLGIKGGGSQ